MAENEGMEGKNLANERRKEAKVQFLEAVKDLKEGENITSLEGLVVTKTKEQYIISMRRITFGIASKDGNFIYMNKLADLENKLNKEGLSLRNLNLPGLEEALDRELEAKEQAENQLKVENDNLNSEGQDTEVGDKKPELEENSGEIIDKQTAEIAKEYNVNASYVIHIAKNKKITDKNFGQIAKWAKDYDDIFVLPGEDEYSRRFIGVKNKKHEEILEAQKQIGGKNPDILIKRIDGSKIEEIKPICMYEIDDKSAVAIVKDQYGRPEALYCRQEGGDKKTFWGTVIPEASGKNVRQQEPETRDFMDYRYNSGEDFTKKADALERQKDLENRGLPSKEDGVQLDEIDGTPRENRNINLEDIEKYLMSRDGIIDKLTVPPGYYENKAQKVLNMMETDKTMQFEDAVEILEKENEREPGGRTPGDRRTRRGA